jgi:hypothetical protein
MRCDQRVVIDVTSEDNQIPRSSFNSFAAKYFSGFVESVEEFWYEIEDELQTDTGNLLG